MRFQHSGAWSSVAPMTGCQSTVESVGPDGACLRAAVPAESPWFGGHFPSEPVLPGVAILSLVQDTLHVLVGPTDRPSLDIVGFRRVRFRSLVRPGDTLRVTVRKSQVERAFDFQVDAGGKLACSGTCSV
jgi:3-hydroxyacyl-[acyl-carrier-protein] dehydratase